MRRKKAPPPPSDLADALRQAMESEARNLEKWARSYLPPVPSLQREKGGGGQIQGATLFATGRLTPTTIRVIEAIKKDGRSPSVKKVADILRGEGARAILFAQLLQSDVVTEWQGWKAEAEKKIRPLRGMQKQAERLGISDTSGDLLAKIGACEKIVQLEFSGSRAAYANPQIKKRLGLRAGRIPWGTILRPLADYLAPFLTPPVRRRKREGTTPQGVYRAVAKIVSAEFPGMFENDSDLVKQALRYHSRTE